MFLRKTASSSMNQRLPAAVWGFGGTSCFILCKWTVFPCSLDLSNLCLGLLQPCVLTTFAALSGEFPYLYLCLIQLTVIGFEPCLLCLDFDCCLVPAFTAAFLLICDSGYFTCACGLKYLDCDLMLPLVCSCTLCSHYLQWPWHPPHGCSIEWL